MTQHNPGHESHAQVAYEQVDINSWSVTKFAVLLVVMSVVSLIVSWGYFGVLHRMDDGARPAMPAMAMHPADREPPAPRLQRTPFDDVRALRVTESAQLEGYGWVDQAAGVTSIPIERAMELYVQRANQPAPAPVVVPSAAPAASVPAARAHR